MRSPRWPWPVAFLCMVPLLSGCTVIGGGLGSVVDSARSNPTRCAVAHVGRGVRIQLHMRDQSLVRARLWGLIEPDTARYAALHAEWSQSETSADVLPEPGERVVVGTGSREFAGTFHGLSPAGVRLFEERGVRLRVFRYAEFETLTDARGRSLTSPFLQQLVADGSVPTGTLVQMQGDREQRRLTDFTIGPTDTLAFDDLERVDVPRERRMQVLGALFGLLADLYVLGALLASEPSTIGW